MDGGAVIVVLAVSPLTALSEDCRQVVQLLCIHSIEGVIQLLSFQKLVEIFQLMQWYARQADNGDEHLMYTFHDSISITLLYGIFIFQPQQFNHV
jgi:hypothetical protein